MAARCLSSPPQAPPASTTLARRPVTSRPHRSAKPHQRPQQRCSCRLAASSAIALQVPRLFELQPTGEFGVTTRPPSRRGHRRHQHHRAACLSSSLQRCVSTLAWLCHRRGGPARFPTACASSPARSEKNQAVRAGDNAGIRRRAAHAPARRRVRLRCRDGASQPTERACLAAPLGPASSQPDQVRTTDLGTRQCRTPSPHDGSRTAVRNLRCGRHRPC